MNARKVLVVGGGIGGMTAAIALARAGLEVAVYERAPEVRECGAGITLQPNAIRALARLGLAATILAAGVPVDRLSLLTSRGQVLMDLRLARLYDEIGAPSIIIHRATLLRLLYQAAGAERVHTACHCAGYVADRDRVRIRLVDGREFGGTLVVGADGIWSTIRAQMLTDSPPRYAGYTAWRGISPSLWGLEPGHSAEIWGRGRRFGMMPIDGTRLYWYATANAPAGEKAPAGHVRSTLLHLFRGWCRPVQAAIDATPESEILHDDVFDRPPTARWGRGRVALLGDAVHPMTPDLGQGACQAIEDAVVLAEELARSEDVERALRRYEARRAPRARWFVRKAHRLGAIGQWQGAFACLARDLGARLRPASTVWRDLRRAWASDP